MGRFTTQLHAYTCHAAARYKSTNAVTCFAYLQHILSFQLPPTAAGAHVAALFKLTEAAAAGSASAAGTPAAWAKQVYNAAHEHLRRYGPNGRIVFSSYTIAGSTSNCA